MDMRILPAILLLIGWTQAGPQVPEIKPDDFARLQGEIRPQPDESPWRDIDWMTSIRGARQRAAAERLSARGRHHHVISARLDLLAELHLVARAAEVGVERDGDEMGHHVLGVHL